MRYRKGVSIRVIFHLILHCSTTLDCVTCQSNQKNLIYIQNSRQKILFNILKDEKMSSGPILSSHKRVRNEKIIKN